MEGSQWATTFNTMSWSIAATFGTLPTTSDSRVHVVNSSNLASWYEGGESTPYYAALCHSGTYALDASEIAVGGGSTIVGGSPLLNIGGMPEQQAVLNQLGTRAGGTMPQYVHMMSSGHRNGATVDAWHLLMGWGDNINMDGHVGVYKYSNQSYVGSNIGDGTDSSTYRSYFDYGGPRYLAFLDDLGKTNLFGYNTFPCTVYMPGGTTSTTMTANLDALRIIAHRTSDGGALLTFVGTITTTTTGSYADILWNTIECQIPLDQIGVSDTRVLANVNIVAHTIPMCIPTGSSSIDSGTCTAPPVFTLNASTLSGVGDTFNLNVIKTFAGVAYSPNTTHLTFGINGTVVCTPR